MNTLNLDSYSVVEMEDRPILDTSGGYGYYPGMFNDAAYFNKTLSEAWHDFSSGFYKGFQDARANKP